MSVKLSTSILSPFAVIKMKIAYTEEFEVNCFLYSSLNETSNSNLKINIFSPEDEDMQFCI